MGRIQPGADLRYAHYYALVESLPTKEALAAELLADAEFNALRLGNWLSSPSGEVIATIVAQVIPETLQPEFGLLVDALKLAADLQQSKGRAQIGFGTAAALLIGLVIREGLKPAPA